MLVFQGPRHDVNCLAYVPGKDGVSIAAGYSNGVRIWPLAGGDAVELPLAPDNQLEGTTGLEQLATSADGNWLAGRWYRGTRLWRRLGRRWDDAGLIPGPGGHLSSTFLGHNLVVVFTAQDSGSSQPGFIILRERPSVRDPQFAIQAKRTGLPHPDNRATFGALAAISADGKFLAATAREKAVHVWDVRKSQLLGTLAQRGFVEALAWTPDGRTLALNAGVTTRLYDVPTMAERLALKVKYSYRPRLAFSPDGRLLATTDTTTGVHLWDTTTGRLRTSLRAGREQRVPVVFAPDGLTVAAGGSSGSVAVWDV
jgi:hypothetical protein